MIPDISTKHYARGRIDSRRPWFNLCRTETCTYLGPDSIIWGSCLWPCMLMDVTDEYLGRLESRDGVRLVESIVHADARNSDVPSTSISFPHAVSDTDGGIDGRVEGAERNGKQGAIKKGLTCYQIKTGNFQPTPSKLRRMLFNNGALKEKIRECFDSDGTFILVLVGRDDPIDNIIKKIRNKLGEEYQNAKIDVWTQSILRGFLENNPYLRLRVLGIDGGSFELYEEWSAQDDMAGDAEIGPEQKEFINTLQRHLDSPSAKYVRIVAEPGIGKTRLVLEALRPNRFSTACIYVDKPSAFIDSQAFSTILKEATSEFFLVVDECDHDTMIEIWGKIKRIPEINLVTIYNERDPGATTMVRLGVPRLGDGQIMNILESYGVPRPRLARWCAMCGRSPRAAHVLGEGLRRNPDQMDTTDAGHVWDLYIASKILRRSDEFKTRKTILLWISSFRRIGFDRPYLKEYRIVQKLLEDHEKIPLYDFTNTIKKLIEMRILQGDTTLYITPKILHLHLWHEWREQYRNIEPKLPGHNLKEAVAHSPEANVLKWRADMPGYASDA